MPNGWEPQSQFEQFVVDKMEYHTKILEKLPCQKEDYDIPSRVQSLESDAKWYKRIFNVIWGVTGGVIVVVVEWILSRNR